MTDPSLYRDDSRVRHMLDAMERITELCKGLGREQLRQHENTTEMILFNLMVLGEASNNITREFAAKNPNVDWKGLIVRFGLESAEIAPHRDWKDRGAYAGCRFKSSSVVIGWKGILRILVPRSFWENEDGALLLFEIRGALKDDLKRLFEVFSVHEDAVDGFESHTDERHLLHFLLSNQKERFVDETHEDERIEEGCMVSDDKGSFAIFDEVFVILKTLNADVHMEGSVKSAESLLGYSPPFLPRISFRVFGPFLEFM